MIVLGIETSCDETAAAVVAEATPAAADPLAIWCMRSWPSTRRSAGWCPRSRRAPMSTISIAWSRRALAEAGASSGELDAVAATAGPGLVGGVMVGLDDRQGDRLGRRQAADRGQPPRRAMR